MSSQLMIGVLLIAAGILLAVVAYWVISGGRSAKELESTAEANGGEEPEATGIITGDPDPLASDDEDISSEIPKLPADVLISTEQDDLETTDEITPEQPPMGDLHSGSEVMSSDMGEDEVEKTGEPDLRPQAGPQISIATLLRDEVTGQLIVKVGDTEYHNADDLRASSDWTRVEYAASDLQTWVAKDAPGQLKIEREPEAVEPKPASMIEQINAILQEKIDSSGRSHLGVRLLESPSGAARVLIGVQSYDLADVPDEDVRQLIQEAVAIWEADQ
ncbi:MAG: hypothetical protein E3J30_05880 [Anaerolineales bacterium]|nr:MAG: hypothetical protein E3J30_05880 [Anaerolineales bacterium]